MIRTPALRAQFAQAPRRTAVLRSLACLVVLCGLPVLRADAVSVTGLTVDNATVQGGAILWFRAQLSGPAPDGASVGLQSDDPNALTLPATVQPFGQDHVVFSALAGSVSVSTLVTLSASYGGGTASTTVTVLPGAAPPRMLFFSITPQILTSGGSATMTISLSGPAPESGVAVSVSGGGSALPLSTTYAVMAGQSSASFTVIAGVVNVFTTLNITAIYGTNTIYASVWINPPPTTVKLGSYTISPSTVTGGDAVTLGLTLTGPAPPGGAAVDMSTGSPAALSLLTPWVIPEGQTSASISVRTGTVTSATTFTSSASFNGASMTATLTVNPATTPTPKLSSVSVYPSTLQAGDSATVNLMLSGPAPPGGAAVSLSSGNPSMFPVPSQFTIPAGQTGASFNETAGPVTTVASIDISAGFGGANLSARVTINPVAPAVILSSLSVSPTSVNSGDMVTVSFSLNGQAPSGGAAISFSSNNSTAAPLPAQSVIPAAQTSGSLTVRISAIATTAIPVTITASYGGATLTATLTVNPATPEAALSSLSVSPASVNSGGTVTVNLTLTAPAPTGGALVSIGSNNQALPVQASYTIPAGQTGGSFTAVAGSVTAATTVSLKALYGIGSKIATVTVNPPAANAPAAPDPSLSSVSITPASVISGGTATVQLMLTGPAPAGGATVTLYSANGAFPVPASYSIPAGQTGGSFTVQTGTVTVAATVSVGAGYRGASKYATESLLPVAAPVSLGGIDIHPTMVASGDAATLALKLTAAAPAGGVVVAITGGGAAFPAQATYTIPEGQLAASFSVQAGAVTTATTVTVLAVYGAASQSAMVTVEPSVSHAPAAVGLSSVAVNPASVAAGSTAQLVLELNGPAPQEGALVSVSSANPAAFPLLSSYLVPAWQTSASFAVEAGSVTAATTVAVGAGFGGNSRVTTTTVTPLSSAPVLSTLAIVPAKIFSAGAVAVTVMLSAPAPPQGATIAFSGGDPVVFPVPSSIVIPSGQTTATFSVQAGTVPSARTVVLSAVYGGATSTADVMLFPATAGAALSSIAVTPATVLSGATATVTLTLSEPAPAEGATLSVFSSDRATFPTLKSYVIGAGHGSVSFGVRAGSVAASTAADITAAYAGQSQSAAVTVAPPSAATLSSMTINPETIASGGTATLAVVLSAPAPAEGALVSISSGDASAFPAPESHLIPAGQRSAYIPIVSGQVTAETQVPVSANYGGQNQVAMVTVLPNPTDVSLVSLQVNSTVVGGSTATVTLTLNGPAPAAGAVVSLSTGDAATFPAQTSYLSPAGQTRASFSVLTGAVAVTTTVPLSAGYGGASEQATVTVTHIPPRGRR